MDEFQVNLPDILAAQEEFKAKIAAMQASDDAIKGIMQSLGGAPDDASSFAPFAPVPPALTLRSVCVVHRHGDRAPVTKSIADAAGDATVVDDSAEERAFWCVLRRRRSGGGGGHYKCSYPLPPQKQEL